MGPDVTATCGDYYKSVSLCLCGPLASATSSLLPEVFREKRVFRAANAQRCSPPPSELQVYMQEVPGLLECMLCAQRPLGPPRCPPGLALNSTGLLGRAQGLMNSSASWRPWMEGRRPPGEDGWTRGWRWRKRHKSRTGFTVLIPQMVEMTSREGSSTQGPTVSC